MRTRLIIVVLLFLITLQSKAQFTAKYDTLVLSYLGYTDSDSLNNYSVIEFNKFDQQYLYKTVLSALNDFYVSPSDVLTTVENNSIIIDAISTDNLIGIKTYEFSYRIVLSFKDKRIKFEPSIKSITEIFYSSRRSIYLIDTDPNIEDSIDAIWMSRKNGKPFLFQKKINDMLQDFMNLYIEMIAKEVRNSDW